MHYARLCKCSITDGKRRTVWRSSRNRDGVKSVLHPHKYSRIALRPMPVSLAAVSNAHGGAVVAELQGHEVLHFPSRSVIPLLLPDTHHLPFAVAVEILTDPAGSDLQGSPVSWQQSHLDEASHAESNAEEPSDVLYELCYILSGRGWLLHQDGLQEPLAAGDSVLMRAGAARCALKQHTQTQPQYLAATLPGQLQEVGLKTASPTQQQQHFSTLPAEQQQRFSTLSAEQQQHRSTLTADQQQHLSTLTVEHMSTLSAEQQQHLSTLSAEQTHKQAHIAQQLLMQLISYPHDQPAQQEHRQPTPSHVMHVQPDSVHVHASSTYAQEHNSMANLLLRNHTAAVSDDHLADLSHSKADGPAGLNQLAILKFFIPLEIMTAPIVAEVNDSAHHAASDSAHNVVSDSVHNAVKGIGIDEQVVQLLREQVLSSEMVAKALQGVVSCDMVTRILQGVKQGGGLDAGTGGPQVKPLGMKGASSQHAAVSGNGATKSSNGHGTNSNGSYSSGSSSNGSYSNGSNSNGSSSNGSYSSSNSVSDHTVATTSNGTHSSSRSNGSSIRRDAINSNINSSNGFRTSHDITSSSMNSSNGFSMSHDIMSSSTNSSNGFSISHDIISSSINSSNGFSMSHDAISSRINSFSISHDAINSNTNSSDGFSISRDATSSNTNSSHNVDPVVSHSHAAIGGGMSSTNAQEDVTLHTSFSTNAEEDVTLYVRSTTNGGSPDTVHHQPTNHLPSVLAAAPVQLSNLLWPPLFVKKRNLTDLTAFRLPNQTNRLALAFEPAEAGLEVSFGVEVFEPGHRTPPHVHAHAHELFFVLAGTGEAFCNEARFSVKAGDCAVMPPTTLHGVDNVSGERLYCLQVMMPNEMFVEFVHSGMAVGHLEDEDLCNLISVRCGASLQVG